MVVFCVTVMLPLAFGSFLLEVMEIQDKGKGYAAAVLGVCGLLLVVFVHILAERLVSGWKGKCLPGKGQMLAEGVIVCLVTGGFTGGAASFDHFLPEKEELTAVSICINGLHMSYEEYTGNASGEDSYGINNALSRYRYTKDGLTEAFSWVCMLAEKESANARPGKAEMKEYPDGFTFAVVCYQMKDGTERYRAYPVDAESFRAFSGVFETKEHKEKAYPVLSWADVSENRFTWKDGVTERVLKLSGEEKKTLFQMYKEDVTELKMEELRTAPPYGVVEIKSDKWGETEEFTVYPFFERTCGFLKAHGAEVEKDITDYPLRSLRVMNVYSAEKTVPGGVTAKYYGTEEELAGWKELITWKELDLQPLLFPFDYGREIAVEAEEPESGAVVEVTGYCSFRSQ